MFCCALLYVHSSFVMILMGKRELAALLSLSSCCLAMVVWLFLAVPWVYLQFVIVVFPDHSHLLFPMGKLAKANNSKDITFFKKKFMRYLNYNVHWYICKDNTSNKIKQVRIKYQVILL